MCGFILLANTILSYTNQSFHRFYFFSIDKISSKQGLKNKWNKYNKIYVKSVVSQVCNNQQTDDDTSESPGFEAQLKCSI